MAWRPVSLGPPGIAAVQSTPEANPEGDLDATKLQLATYHRRYYYGRIEDCKSDPIASYSTAPHRAAPRRTAFSKLQRCMK